MNNTIYATGAGSALAYHFREDLLGVLPNSLSAGNRRKWAELAIVGGGGVAIGFLYHKYLRKKKGG